MLPRISTLLFLFATSIIAFGEATPAPSPKATPNKKDPALLPIADVPGLPRVLLIGDSISIGYTLEVRKRLEGRANVHHPPENCGPSSRGVYHIDQWLGHEHWDVITFNFGLHDLKYFDEQNHLVAPDQGKQVALPPEYGANLHEIARLLKHTGAKLVFVNTTPVPAGSEGRVQGDEKKYNGTAAHVMEEESIPVLDLCAVVEQRQSEWQLPNNVHFTPDGYSALADAVAAKIQELLPAH